MTDSFNLSKEFIDLNCFMLALSVKTKVDNFSVGWHSVK